MVLVGAAVLPHGTMIFDGDPHSESVACRKRNSSMPTGLIKQCSALYSSCERAADLLAKMNPDVVILVTPHGVTPVIWLAWYLLGLCCARKRSVE